MCKIILWTIRDCKLYKTHDFEDGLQLLGASPEGMKLFSVIGIWRRELMLFHKLLYAARRVFNQRPQKLCLVP
jgi:hypothetical protein